MSSGVSSRGPVPKRSEESHRQGSPYGEPVALTKMDEMEAFSFGVDLRPTPPAPGEKWPEQVVDLYRSLANSPSIMFMYESDWMLAWQLCEQLSRELRPQFVGMAEQWNSEAQAMETVPVREVRPMAGSKWSALEKTLRALGVTEEARRRMHIEAPPVHTEAHELQVNDDDGVVTDLATVRAQRLADGT